MKKILLAAAILAASTAATPAFCKDGEAFTGPWVGATLGYDKFTAGDNDDDDGADDGVTYGVALGYDANFGGVVLGVEAELADSSIRASSANILEEGDSLTVSARRDLYAGVRVGVPSPVFVLSRSVTMRRPFERPSP